MAGFNTAVTGLKSASTMLDVAGNNIANSATVGFKASRTEFADIYATSVVGAGSSNSPGSGVTVSDISQDFSAGTIEFTNNNLDLAINGSGFFQLNDGNGGVTYTRAGAFELDKDGFIVSKNGSFLQGYGLDEQNNILPLQNLAVTNKESAPKATETMSLSVNIDSAQEPPKTTPFNKDVPSSFSYSTTVETVDSLGNSNSIRYYFVEQAPVRETYAFDMSTLATPGTLTSVGYPNPTTDFVDFSSDISASDITFSVSLQSADSTAPLEYPGASAPNQPALTTAQSGYYDLPVATAFAADGDYYEVNGIRLTYTSADDAGAAGATVNEIAAAWDGIKSDALDPATLTDLNSALAGTGLSFSVPTSYTAGASTGYFESSGSTITFYEVAAGTGTPVNVDDNGTPSAPAATGTYETASFAFQPLKAGESLTIDGLTFTAGSDLGIAEVQGAFANYANGVTTASSVGGFSGGLSGDFDLVEIDDVPYFRDTTSAGVDVADIEFFATGTGVVNLSNLASSFDSPYNLTDIASKLQTGINEALGASTGKTYVTVEVEGDQLVYTLNDPEMVNSGAILTFASTNTDVQDLLGIDTSVGTATTSFESFELSGYPLSVDDLLNLEDNIINDPIRSVELQELDPRIDINTLSYDASTGLLSFQLKASETETGDVVIAGTDGTEISLQSKQNLPSNEVHTLTLDDSSDAFEFPPLGITRILSETVEINIGGVSVTLGAGLTLDEIGETLVNAESDIIDKNPDIESVAFDVLSNQFSITYRPEVGNVPTTPITSNSLSVDAPSAAPFATDTAGQIAIDVNDGDNSYLGEYRLYAYLNNETALDIGKAVDPGEGGSTSVPPRTEVGPISVSFDPTSGQLAAVNGLPVNGGVAPTITIQGADLANPDSDGISLDLSGSSQFASDSIVKAADQDGYPKGDLIGVSFNPTGEMVASFSNGEQQNLGLVAIATFENQSGLQPAGNTEWIASLASGAAILNPPGAGLNGTLRSAALEQSNVDLSAELVKLIEGQRNFQANSKTLETLNTVTQAILQI